MKTEAYYLFLQKYIAEHSDDFVASHETNSVSVPEKILSSGLRVSHSPYGRKIRHFTNESGKIDLEHAFMATMDVIDSKSLTQNKFFYENPTAPVVINIPRQLLNTADISHTDEDTHKFFCGYGFEEQPAESERCGKITPLSSDDADKANVRVLPSFLIAGYFNPESGRFIENDKHFSKLPKEEQDKIIQQYTKMYELLNQNQPQ